MRSRSACARARADRQARHGGAEGGGGAARPAGAEPAGGRGLRPGRSRPPGRWPRAWPRPLATTPDIVGIDTSLRPMRRVPSCGAAPARRSAGHPGGQPSRRPCRARCRAPTRPTCTTASPSTRCRCGCSCRASARSGWTRCWPCRCARQRPAGAAVGAGARRTRRDRQAAVHQGPAAGVVYVSATSADMAGQRGFIDSPLYGLFAIRSQLAAGGAARHGELGEYWIRQPSDPSASTRSSGTASRRSPTRPSATWAPPTAWA
jgi:hypothetical protein